MAQYEHLPIYRRAFELAVYVEKVVRGFSRHHKYTLGARLEDGSFSLLERVVRAQNVAPVDRARQLEELRVEVEVLKNLLHLGKEAQAFKSFSAFDHAAGLAVDVGRQTEGWLKSTKALQAPESRPTNSREGRP